MNNQALIDKLNQDKFLEEREWFCLIDTFTDADQTYAEQLARDITVSRFGRKIFFRGIIEFTNYCRNNCFYCGIRRSNTCLSRYRLTDEEILECCEEGYNYGFRTFVLQGGEDMYYSDDRLVELVRCIRKKYSECAITLSVGERSRESYQALYQAGADRYLLRHETADEDHYQRIHPAELSWVHRMNCLKELKKIGFQTGCGMMIGSPFQTTAALVKDMQFLHDFRPAMVGIGPFIPHQDTPFRDMLPGSPQKTLFFLSLCRIMLPDALIPATTALGTLRGDGRQLGVLAGCNVIMPNLSPMSVRKKYMLYDNKCGTDLSAKEGIALLRKQMRDIGYEVIVDRGDYWERE